MNTVRGPISRLLAVCVFATLAGVASAQTFGATPQALSFTYQINGTNPPAQSIYVTSDTPSAQFAVSISGAPWLTVTPTSGVAPATLIVTASGPAGATAGTLNGTIIIGPPASVDAVKTVVGVSLKVLAPAQGDLVATPSSLTFSYRAGGPYPSVQSVTIGSTGAPAAFTLSSTASWVAWSASSYVTPSQMIVSVVPPPSMAPGYYSAWIDVNPAYAGGVKKQISIVLTISAGGALTASPPNLSFSYQLGGSQPVSQALSVVSSTGQVAPFAVTTATSNGGSWLGVSPITGATPISLIVTAYPGNLPPATYSGVVTITPAVAGLSKTEIPVTLTVYSYSQLLVDPTSLTFSYQAGGPQPPHQYLSVRSTGSPVTFHVEVSGPSWVTTSFLSAATPAGLTVYAAPPSTAAPGAYVATVTLSPTTGGGTVVSVPVTVNVTDVNYLTVGQSSVAFDYAKSGPNPAPAVVTVTSSGGSIPVQASAATVGFGPWLHVSQSSAYTPAELTISVNPQGLDPGTYAGSVTVTSQGASNSPQTIEVKLTIGTTAFTASPFGLVFSAQAGGTPPPAQMLVIRSNAATAGFTAKTTTTSGANWLMVAGQGTAPSTLAAGVSVAGLGVGTYSGRIVITPTTAGVPTLEIPVVLNIGAGPVIQPAASQVAFQYKINGPAPATQKVVIGSNTNDGVIYYTTTLTGDGGTWLTVSPDVGVTKSELTVAVDPQGLAAGLYYGLIGLHDTAGDAPSSFVPVTLQVSDTQILTMPSQSIVFNAQAGVGGSFTQGISVKGTGQASSYHVTTAGGSWLYASPIDGFTDSTVTVTAVADNLAPGYYLGLVTVEIPGVPNSQIDTPVSLIVAPGFQKQ
jgi:hypothetical protein